MSKKEFNVTQIGIIKTNNNEFKIELDKKYVNGLKELEKFSHAQIIWWCHHVDNLEYRNFIECPKPYKKAPDIVGIFATRSPARPNPIAITIVPILNINMKDGIITLPFIDAENDTPVLDIKPYHPSTDRVKDVNVPQWCKHWPQWYEDSATFDWQSEFVFAK